MASRHADGVAASGTATDYDKYKSLLKEGKSRYEIDSCLRQDSLSPEAITSFWQHVGMQALNEAASHTPADDIAAVWRRIQQYQYYQRGFSLPQVPARKQPGDLRVVFISDTHSLHDDLPPIPDGDVLVHGGDFTDTGDRNEVLAFNEFLGKLPHRYKIVIAGNHETTFEKAYYKTHWDRYGHPIEYDPDDVRSLLTNALYVEDALVTVEGYRIFGSPWQPAFCDWAFNLPRGSDELKAKWTAIPSDVDILVTHSPPMGRGDNVQVLRVGDVHLLQQVQTRIKPAFHLFGHVHEGYGASFDGTTIFINGSNCTDEYKAINPIVVFDLPPRMAAGVDDATDYHSRMAQQLVQQSPLKRFAIRGTSADQIYEETLRVRPVVSATTRAMKYCFRGKKMEATSPTVESSTTAVDRASVQLAGPNYSIATSGTALSRRITMSVLPQEGSGPPSSLLGLDQAPSLDKRLSQNMRLNTQPPPPVDGRRRGLAKRQGLAVLPEEDSALAGESSTVDATAKPDDDCVLCRLNVPGHNHVSSSLAVVAAVAPPATRDDVVEEVVEEETCVLCKFKVNGHVHPGREKVAAAPPAEQPKAALAPLPPPADASAASSKRISSWF